ncbi:MAG: co-chaperone GroES, partial [Campylobacterales bacterium]|nr:co-chaperone GroES [Campylobacterales bacterium]
MNFKPLGERILVERKEEETKTASGIIIPDNAKEKPLQGTVVAVSNAVEKAGEVKVGDEVMFGKYGGTEVSIDGKDYLVLATGLTGNDVI